MWVIIVNFLLVAVWLLVLLFLVVPLTPLFQDGGQLVLTAVSLGIPTALLVKFVIHPFCMWSLLKLKIVRYKL